MGIQQQHHGRRIANSGRPSKRTRHPPLWTAGLPACSQGLYDYSRAQRDSKPKPTVPQPTVPQPTGGPRSSTTDQRIQTSSGRATRIGGLADVRAGPIRKDRLGKLAWSNQKTTENRRATIVYYRRKWT